MAKHTPSIAASPRSLALPTSHSRWVTLGEISQMLKNRFGSYKEDTGTFRKLGVALNRPDYRYDNRHTKTGVVYFVRQKTE